MTPEQAKALVETFAHMRLRPKMYLSGELKPVFDFLAGFNMACWVLDAHPFDDEGKVWEERGWRWSARHPIEQMIEQNMDDETILEETLTVLMITLQRKYGVTDEPIIRIHDTMRKSIESTKQQLANPGKNSIYQREAISESEHKRIEYMESKLNRIERMQDRP